MIVSKRPPTTSAEDLVWQKALLLWEEPAARVWMDSANAYLGGATPRNVVAIRGPAEVLDALDAALAGAYA